MCKIYNSIGSLTTLKSHLLRHDINDFKSLKEVIDFKDLYSINRQKIISEYENLIEQEKIELQSELLQLDTTIEEKKLYKEKELNEEIRKLNHKLKVLTSYTSTNYFGRLTKLLKSWYFKKRLFYIEKNAELKVKEFIKTIVNLRQEKSNRHQFISSHFNDAVKESCIIPLAELDRKKTIIDELSSHIYGALGEQKVVMELENLSDEYFLINDFSISFSNSIYNSQENDYIKSIQIDHILVSTSGIFLIETKNWSEKSIENLSLRSPVEQIKRTSFVLFKLLNNKIRNYHLQLDKHHWGDKKIPLRNLIVLTNNKPIEDFQYVKVLTLNELIGYVKYFKPIFSSTETQRITDYLVNINDQKKYASLKFGHFKVEN